MWRRSSHHSASVVSTCAHLPSTKVQCSRFGKQPCPVCQRACRKYRVCQAPEEKALVITLITTMALQLLVPATLAKECFMKRKAVAPQGDNHVLTVLHHMIIYYIAYLLHKWPCYVNIELLQLLIRRNYERLHLPFISHFLILFWISHYVAHSYCESMDTLSVSVTACCNLLVHV